MLSSTNTFSSNINANMKSVGGRHCEEGLEEGLQVLLKPLELLAPTFMGEDLARQHTWCFHCTTEGASWSQSGHASSSEHGVTIERSCPNSCQQEMSARVLTKRHAKTPSRRVDDDKEQRWQSSLCLWKWGRNFWVFPPGLSRQGFNIQPGHFRSLTLSLRTRLTLLYFWGRIKLT